MTELSHAEWIALRKTCITGTDIAAIMGLSKYASPMTVFMDKLGLSEPIRENEAMKWGKLLEPVIAHRYADDMGLTIEKGHFLRDGIVGGTPDYLAPDRLIEIKTAGIRSAHLWGEPGTDQIPDPYLCQVQWYLNLTKMDKADVAVLIGGQDYRIYCVGRNQNLIDILTEGANEFWNLYIVPEIPPPLDGSAGAKKYLESFFPRSRGNILRADYDDTLKVRELINVRETLESLEDKKAQLENQIKLAIGDNDGIEDPTFRCTWRSTKDSEKTDYEKLVKSLNVSPEIIKEFTVTKPGIRRFLLTYNKED